MLLIRLFGRLRHYRAVKFKLFVLADFLQVIKLNIISGINRLNIGAGSYDWSASALFFGFIFKKRTALLFWFWKTSLLPGVNQAVGGRYGRTSTILFGSYWT